MSDDQDPLFTIANLLDFPVARVRDVIAAARQAHPEGSEEDVRRLAFRALEREAQDRSLKAARESIGR